MKIYEVAQTRLFHAGGSKFYESRVFLPFQQAEEMGYKPLVVFRWGKMEKVEMGGEIMLRTGANMTAVAAEKLREKMKRGYVEEPAARITRALEEEMILPYLRASYRAVDIETILQTMKAGVSARSREDDEIVLEEPPIDRGDDWASW